MFDVLEEELRKEKAPVDCVTLFERANVRKYAASANRVSDYLGHMWRKGFLTRLPSGGDGSRSRWVYQWKGRQAAQPPEGPGQSYVNFKQTLLDKPHVRVTEEDGTVTIELPNFKITVQAR